ncbi:uncharacterized protein N0V89_004520 [Didymosphaeria variabile]|uniref:RRM domain-containing protein n=1 Tax=Didymosphaeria variabile TaxID=1932322 RepID=A0A9W9CDN3_9PLEO|nr:uncharacterized protein N0V89_004520 [Didymosphaeria variabile]KAJ4356486.1 hypothetical protein N0V89_004520 [Didymosphaeria variabile]
MSTNMNSSSTLVRVTNLSPGTDPIVFYNDILPFDLQDSVSEIEMVLGRYYGRIFRSTSTMYVFMDSHDSAQRAVQELDGLEWGKSHLCMPMTLKIVPLTEAPGAAALKRLSDFLAIQKSMPDSKTVRFDNIPSAHKSKVVRELFDESTFALYIDEDVPNDTEKSSNDWIKYIQDGDELLVRFVDVDSAKNIVLEYNGTYYKNETIYATCVDDKALDDIVEEREQAKLNNTTAKLFIGAVKPGASTEDVRKMFAPHVPKDIQMQPGKSFAFVFMHEDAAAKFMAAYPNGKKHGGWNYRVKYANDKKGGKGKRVPAASVGEFMATPASGPIDTETYGGYSSIPVKVEAPVKKVALPKPAPAPAPVQGPVMVRVNGLAYAATEDQVRKVFENAKFQVEEVVLHNSIASDIHAVVKLASHEEAERALSVLNGRKILKRKIEVVKAT